MITYKGFDKNLQCRDFQYAVDEEYTTDEAIICECGFHACENPIDVLQYYEPNESRYCVVDVEDNGERKEDSKVCGKRIKILREITLLELTQAAVEYANKHESANSSTGYSSANEAHGKDSICVGWGVANKCKGVVGCVIVPSEWNDGVLAAWKAVEVDGETIKADTWYTLKDGEIVEAE